MARALMRALSEGGHSLDLASIFGARDTSGDAERQRRLDELGRRLAKRFLRQVKLGLRPRPDLWFTYHLYYRAVDWIGPHVAKALSIPYVLAEASLAPKRAGGPWDHSHRAAVAAVSQAAAIFPINPTNSGCLPDKSKLKNLPPFMDLSPLAGVSGNKNAFPLPPDRPWIAVSAMMRNRAKLDSYRAIAASLNKVTAPFCLLIIGDGPARAEVETLFQDFAPGQVHFTGELSQNTYLQALASGDLFFWPAINEAYGMALLEAQALGLPAIAGRHGGVPAIVEEGVTGCLCDPNDPSAFAEALNTLLLQPDTRKTMGAAARQKAQREHSLPAATALLNEALAGLAPSEDTAA
ncbi:glycosyltransferase family 4 protein [Rhodovibrionaceae bacterium A322]